MSLSRISCVLLLLVVSETISFSNSLTGDHVCSRIENYTVTSYETYAEPVVVNTFTWCLQIPPRCPKTLTELRQRYRVKTEEKSRTVEECCEGYKMLMIHNDAETDARCLPYCKKCLAGVCVAPNECKCNPGYHGEDCSLECPSGSWGPRCMGACNCGENGTCDPVNGTCRCSPGRQGLQCREACAIGRWGSDCANECTCQNRNNDCDAVTGKCTDDDDVSLVGRTPPVYLQSSTTERVQTSRISNVEYTEVFSAPRETTEHQTKDVDNLNDTNYVSETTTPVSASFAIPSQKATVNVTPGRDPATTARSVIVLVSVPERKRDVEKNRQKFPTKDAFLRHVQSDGSIGVSDIDYVKTIHKDDIQTPAPIPLDIALIVVAAIVSLGLTSLAVVMVLHMRSKLFETVRLAVYDDGKSKSRECESANAGRMSTVINSALPPLPTRANPGFTINAEPEAILTVNGIESLNTYANGTAAIGLRISGLHDFLQDGHYDRPPATLICLQTTNFDHNAEHVYDEIPLQTTPQCSRKDL
ncbi:Multiple epidermal growth factor-like domains protein [Ooceraea biroi]|uniref:Multiple epidermal growth factor-like domains protein n=1 Tax=Ooceraea biroi TaxID=2015173 RepID=A0A026VXP7_OOCBI|nr:Multiple epidermal growth factor-like domains protein [Ooceraea biroi]